MLRPELGQDPPVPFAFLGGWPRAGSGSTCRRPSNHFGWLCPPLPATTPTLGVRWFPLRGTADPALVQDREISHAYSLVVYLVREDFEATHRRLLITPKTAKTTPPMVGVIAIFAQPIAGFFVACRGKGAPASEPYPRNRQG